MKVKIFTEGDSIKGYGHIVRCHALYNEFKSRGVQIELVIEGNNDIVDIISENDYSLINWTKDLNYIKKSIAGTQCVIFDSYNIDEKFCEEILNYVQIPVFIDFIQRLKYKGGILVDASPNLIESVHPKVNILKGYKYALLRRNFLHVNSKRIMSNNLKKILLTFGGSDPRDLTNKILEMLPTEEYSVDIILGPGYDKSNNLNPQKNINIYASPSTEEIVKLMIDADLAITSGGQTLFEIAKLGLPGIVIKAAENQKTNINFFCSNGMHYAGAWDDESLRENVLRALKKLTTAKERIKSSKKLKDLIDGEGASRIVDKILTYEKAI